MKNITKKAKSIVKGFKDETIEKLLHVLLALIEIYRKMIIKGIALKVSISDGNKKIGRVMNVSLAPIVTCGSMCKYCKRHCYDIKACLQYENVRIARAKNTALAKYARQEFFDQIDKKLKNRKANFFFRWHVSGDILDGEYLNSMIQLATKYQYITFWTYTKKYAIVNRWISENGNLPQNLHIMFSQWKVKTDDGQIKAIPFPNPYNMPIFTVRFNEEEPPKNMFKCAGNCDFCKVHRCGCIAGQDTYNDAH